MLPFLSTAKTSHTWPPSSLIITKLSPVLTGINIAPEPSTTYRSEPFGIENTFGCKIALGFGGPVNTSGYWLKFIAYLSKLALKE